MVKINKTKRNKMKKENKTSAKDWYYNGKGYLNKVNKLPNIADKILTIAHALNKINNK